MLFLKARRRAHARAVPAPAPQPRVARAGKREHSKPRRGDVTPRSLTPRRDRRRRGVWRRRRGDARRDGRSETKGHLDVPSVSSPPRPMDDGGRRGAFLGAEMRRWLDGGVGEFESRSGRGPASRRGESRWRRSWARRRGTFASSSGASKNRARRTIEPRRIWTRPDGVWWCCRNSARTKRRRCDARTGANRRSRRLVRAETRGMGAEGGGETRTRGDVAGRARRAHSRDRGGAAESESARVWCDGTRTRSRARGRRISSATWKSFRGRRTRCVVARGGVSEGGGERV